MAKPSADTFASLGIVPATLANITAAMAADVANSINNAIANVDVVNPPVTNRLVTNQFNTTPNNDASAPGG